MTALTWAVVLLFPGPTRAQGDERAGIPAGPWRIAPLVYAHWGYDTNPFYANDASGEPGEASARYALGVGGTLPFRQSHLRLAYRRDLLWYGRTTLIEDTVDDVQGDLGLRFSSGDDLDVRTSWTRGIADTLRFDPGGETVFRGDPYRFREVSAIAAREASVRPGYEVAVSRRDLNFPEEAGGIDYFEYRGWEFRAEYRHPLSQNLAVTAGYGGRRFRHFCDDEDPSRQPCPGVGTPFRRESGDSVNLGLRGLARERSPFSLRVGWLDLGYGAQGSPGFEGPVGDASLRLALSAGTWIEGSLVRQAYSSFYSNNNYFIYSAAQVRYGVQSADRWDAAVGVLFAQTSYEFPDAGGYVREDDTLRMDAYANLFLSGGFGVRFAVADERRGSTVPGLDFDRRTFVVGAFFGWL